ncbi:hypothetical protein BOTBODRAFT_450098 [Botryobasidium botryosum FD-172 SS1]|uniref:C2H2-type domain-containing protein n=1 Tax=Botryobasidium botryosum (strain FD-172 SS1) TaxID=930990 RepID=A0A067MAK0_BOTB1|nr:hypothetical protein BOTBODRAFT_450098 [Botryobasidium botryosum FD-172 SS1]
MDSTTDLVGAALLQSDMYLYIRESQASTCADSPSPVDYSFTPCPTPPPSCFLDDLDGSYSPSRLLFSADLFSRVSEFSPFLNDLHTFPESEHWGDQDTFSPRGYSKNEPSLFPGVKREPETIDPSLLLCSPDAEHPLSFHLLTPAVDPLDSYDDPGMDDDCNGADPPAFVVPSCSVDIVRATSKRKRDAAEEAGSKKALGNGKVSVLSPPPTPTNNIVGLPPCDDPPPTRAPAAPTPVSVPPPPPAGMTSYHPRRAAAAPPAYTLPIVEDDEADAEGEDEEDEEYEEEEDDDDDYRQGKHPSKLRKPRARAVRNRRGRPPTIVVPSASPISPNASPQALILDILNENFHDALDPTSKQYVCTYQQPRTKNADGHMCLKQCKRSYDLCRHVKSIHSPAEARDVCQNKLSMSFAYAFVAFRLRKRKEEEFADPRARAEADVLEEELRRPGWSAGERGMELGRFPMLVQELARCAGEFSNQCPQCDRSFSREDALVRHIVRIHSEDDQPQGRRNSGSGQAPRKRSRC